MIGAPEWDNRGCTMEATAPTDETPHPPAHLAPEAPYREFTLAATIVGVAIGCVMTAAFVYVCLKLGFGLGGSTVAAILEQERLPHL